MKSTAAKSNNGNSAAELISTIGYILAVSYPVLALSTGVRAIYQLLNPATTYYFPPAMSGVAALCYLVATIGFAYRRKWSWWLSVAVLAPECPFPVTCLPEEMIPGNGLIMRAVEWLE